MKRTLTCCAVVFVMCTSWKNHDRELAGTYRGGFGGTIILRSDSTFRFEWRFDLVDAWNIGTWKSEADTVWLNVIPVYDTVNINPPGDTPRDSIYLSRDSIPNRFVEPEPKLGHATFQGGRPFPQVLYYEKDHLYPLGADRKPDKKSSYKFAGKSYPAYYVKVDESGKPK